MSKITYEDKVAVNVNPDIPDINKVTADDMNEIKRVVNAILDEICPVGKTEIFYDNEDHSDYLGFTWERTSVGRSPVGIDPTQTEFNTIGKTGGAKTHTLVNNEIPSHNHSGLYWNNSRISFNAGSSGYKFNWNSGGNSDEKLFTTGNIGGGQAHNNLQPYEVFAIWKRVA